MSSIVRNERPGVRLSCISTKYLKSLKKVHQMEYGIKHIEQSLKDANTLAYCDHIINDLRDGKELSSECHQWVYRMFNMGIYHKYQDAELGAIVEWMMRHYCGPISIKGMLRQDLHDIYQDLKQLNQKIENTYGDQQLTHTDWDLILNGVEQYRHKLLGEYHQAPCVRH